MKFVFTKNIVCGKNCADDIIKALELKTGAVLQAVDDTSMVSGHVSISHVPNEHKIWVYLYDVDGKHESEKNGKDVIKNNNRVLKFKGVKPTRQQVESI